MFEGHHIDRLTDAISGAARAMQASAAAIEALAVAKTNEIERHLSPDDQKLVDKLEARAKHLQGRLRAVTKAFKKLDNETK